MRLYVDEVNLNDLEDVNKMWALAHQLHVDKVPNKFKPKTEDKYTKESLSLALFSGTKIIGCYNPKTGEMLGMLEFNSTFEDISKIKLKCLFVKEEHRGMKVGKKLFKYLMAYFNQFTFLKTMEGRSYIKESRSFWTKRGFVYGGQANEFAVLLKYIKEE